MRRLRRVSALRRVAVPTYIYWRRIATPGYGPRILVNSIPKAGTHLLASQIRKLPGVAFSGVVTHHAKHSVLGPEIGGAKPDFSIVSLRDELQKVPRGSFVNGHLYWDKGTLELLEDLEYRVLHVIRDPRDILVSMLHYLQEFPAHPAHSELVRQFPDRDARLMALIEGFPASKWGIGMAPVGQRLDPFLGWMNHPNVFRYEDLTGSDTNTVALFELRRLLRAIDFPASDENVRLLVGGANDPWSATFRTGGSGRWRQHFSSEHLARFEELAAAQTACLGY